METMVALVAPAETLRRLQEQVSGPDFEWSEPTSLTSVADVLDSPIGGEEIRQGLEMAILIFKTGAAALVFAKAASDLLKVSTDAVVVKDASTGAKKGTITTSSSLSDVEAMVKG
jgi:hypothetical protein